MIVWQNRKNSSGSYPVDKDLKESKTQAFKELLEKEGKKGRWDRFMDWIRGRK